MNLATPLSARAEAEARQREASHPDVSAFVGASAGSGKTKLLTDRLLRLLLHGADPARVQCLTFTKAAAAEMEVRLRERLARWVVLDTEALDRALRDLDIDPSAETRALARALFARVLDLPGGMRIGTIHAFCQSLLRRFPLEAELSPHFQVIEEADSVAALFEAQEDVLAEAHRSGRREALETLAGLFNVGQFAELIARLRASGERLRAAAALGPDALAAAQRRILGVVHADEDALLAHAVDWPAAARLRDAARSVAERGSPAVVTRAGQILAWLGRHGPERAADWAGWRALFFAKSGKPCAPRTMVNDKLAALMPPLLDAYLAEQDRIAAVEDARCAQQVAAISAALLRLALPVAEAFEQRKQGAGKLDYEDLIGRTSRLMEDPGVAWVMYKLDGGLDHLLLDEVQDTAETQWRIADALTAEFFAGAGARDRRRTVFAVGDRKQSIYSFQGAEPGGFDRWRRRLGERVAAAGETWRDVRMNVSFRSTAPVLELVGAVFANPLAAAGVLADGEDARHLADRAGHAGLVELWPLAPAPEPDEPEPWSVPDAYRGRTSAPQALAQALAAWIAGQIGTPLESRGKPLAAGDVLVLVRRRGPFATGLVRELKKRGVPVAGLDRMSLAAQPAVADLLALCETLLLPQDDLSLACVLTSPLGFLSDDSLMQLAIGRPGSLWDALRARAGERPDWTAAAAFLAALFARVDFASPHALLSEALGPLGGRARLFARLGPEAAEPVDELLNAALTFGRTHPPSLQGFLHWLRQSGAEVRREPEGAGDAVRIMTVHGAKGLQAPLVVLPDTTAPVQDRQYLLWEQDPATGTPIPLWAPLKALACSTSERLKQAAQTLQAEEENRLLYVALTRAEDRLLVCGWETKGERERSWYNLVRAGFDQLEAPAVAHPGLAWGEVRRLTSPQAAAVPAAPARAAAAPSPLPSWAGAAPDWRPAPPPPEPDLPSPLAPSRPENAGLGPVPHAASPLAAREEAGLRLRRGQLLHSLLQHLPALPPERRLAAATDFLARPGHGLPPGQPALLAAETVAILEHPDLAPLFGPDSRAEVPLTGVVAGQVIGGLVDRLAILPEAILVADYKTNRDPPETPEATPVLYLRQLAAYRAVLRAIFPGRPVRCALVWTRAARIDTLPDALLDRHAPGQHASDAELGGLA